MLEHLSLFGMSFRRLNTVSKGFDETAALLNVH